MKKFNSILLLTCMHSLFAEFVHHELKHGLRSHKHHRPSDAVSTDSLEEFSEINFIDRNIYDLVFNSSHTEQIMGHLVKKASFIDKLVKNYDHYQALLRRVEYYIFDPYFQQAVKTIAKKTTLKYLSPQDLNLDVFTLNTVKFLKPLILEGIMVKPNSSGKSVNVRVKPEASQEAKDLLDGIFTEYKRILKQENRKAPERVDTNRNRSYSTLKDAVSTIQKKFPTADSVELEFINKNLAPCLNVYGGVYKKNRFDRIDSTPIKISQFEQNSIRILFFPKTKLTEGNPQRGHVKISDLMDFLNNTLVLGDLRPLFHKLS